MVEGRSWAISQALLAKQVVQDAQAVKKLTHLAHLEYLVQPTMLESLPETVGGGSSRVRQLSFCSRLVTKTHRTHLATSTCKLQT